MTTLNDKLTELLKTAVKFVPDELILDDELPDTIAAAFEKASTVQHKYNSIDGWSIYSNDRYQKIIDRNELALHVRKFIRKCKVKGKTKTRRVKQSTSLIKDTMQALAAMYQVHILPGNKAPASFNSCKLKPETTIALKNGLLDIRKMKVHPFTPDFYTFNYLPVEYDPKCKAEVWTDKMLAYYFTEEDKSKPDRLAQDVLHSWYKRWLLSIVWPHKICAIIGDPRSGKSTIGRIACSFLGQANVASITIASLAGTHGLYSLMNKQLGIMWDAAITGRSNDMHKAVEVLKNISGQDNIAVNPKNRDIIELSAMPLNILMIANTIADLRDSSGALASRFTFLETTQDFLGQEDPSMEEHVIKNELPGILNLILTAPDTIIEHPNSAIMGEEFLEMSSPYTAFAKECCVIGDSNCFIPHKILWAAYCEWCNQHKHYQPSLEKFVPGFRAAIRGVGRYQPHLKTEQIESIIEEYNLFQKWGEPVPVSPRPRCFSNIDLKNDKKGVWLDVYQTQENRNATG